MARDDSLKPLSLCSKGTIPPATSRSRKELLLDYCCGIMTFFPSLFSRAIDYLLAAVFVAATPCDYSDYRARHRSFSSNKVAMKGESGGVILRHPLCTELSQMVGFEPSFMSVHLHSGSRGGASSHASTCQARKSSISCSSSQSAGHHSDLECPKPLYNPPAPLSPPPPRSIRRTPRQDLDQRLA